MASNHILLIIGGSLDFSLALARQASKKGWSVARASSVVEDEQIWLDTLSDLSCERAFISSPLTKESHYRDVIERIHRRWGRVDTVINFAVDSCLGLFESSSDADWRWTYDNNLLAITRGNKAAISLMKRQGHGQILNITTQAARIPQPGLALASALQGAVVNLSETLQAELAPLDIDVRLACVDAFDGLTQQPARAQTPLDTARYERKLNRSMSMDDIAAAILKGLASNEFLILTHKSSRTLWWRYRMRYGKWLEVGKELAIKLRPENRFLRRH